MENNKNNERGNEMTFEFDDFDTEIQSDETVDERISDEDLESAAEFYDELEFLLDGLDFVEELDKETRLADEEWDAHWEAMNMNLLDASGDIHDHDDF
jgi:hypothetical protein